MNYARYPPKPPYSKEKQEDTTVSSLEHLLDGPKVVIKGKDWGLDENGRQIEVEAYGRMLRHLSEVAKREFPSDATLDGEERQVLMLEDEHVQPEAVKMLVGMMKEYCRSELSYRKVRFIKKEDVNDTKKMMAVCKAYCVLEIDRIKSNIMHQMKLRLRRQLPTEEECKYMCDNFPVAKIEKPVDLYENDMINALAGALSSYYHWSKKNNVDDYQKREKNIMDAIKEYKDFSREFDRALSAYKDSRDEYSSTEPGDDEW